MHSGGHDMAHSRCSLADLQCLRGHGGGAALVPSACARQLQTPSADSGSWCMLQCSLSRHRWPAPSRQPHEPQQLPGQLLPGPRCRQQGSHEPQEASLRGQLALLIIWETCKQVLDKDAFPISHHGCNLWEKVLQKQAAGAYKESKGRNLQCVFAEAVLTVSRLCPGDT